VMDETMADLKQRFGNVSYPEVSEATDNLYAEIVAVDGVRTTEESKRSSYIFIEKVEKKEQKKFIGLKKEDEVEFDVTKIFTDENLISQAINVSAEEAKTAAGKFTIKITTISRTEPAEINPEFFDKVFGKDVVKTEEEFIAKIKETIAENYKRETDHLLDHEIQHHFVDHTKVNMPDNFLKLWLKEK
jgi:trigger factor